MKQPEQQAVLTLCLMAAFADGTKSDTEREQLKRIAEGFPDLDMNPAQLYSDVLMRRIPLSEVARELVSPEARNLAYEMAVCVCDADGVVNDAEKEFLASLRRELKLDAAPTRQFEEQIETLVSIPLENPKSLVAPVLLASDSSTPTADKAEPGLCSRGSSSTSAGPSVVDEAELDRLILNYSILNGALELLPQSISTMAIIPLQMKMVHGIGQRYGYSLDRGHIRELLATLGVGLSSQVVEGFVLKLMGGLLNKFVGHGMTHALADQTASSAIAFATTYGLGQVARRYYAGGRSMSTIDMKGLFSSLSDNAKKLHARYMPQIQEQANNLDAAKVLQMIRGR